MHYAYNVLKSVKVPKNSGSFPVKPLSDAHLLCKKKRFKIWEFYNKKLTSVYKIYYLQSVKWFQVW